MIGNDDIFYQEQSLNTINVEETNGEITIDDESIMIEK
jgi:hypothetical protein